MNGNSFMSCVTRSPFHRMLSGSTMLITVTCCKTGRAITTPVNYSREGNTLWVTSYRKRSWWRNLRGGRPVSLSLRGKEVHGWGKVIEDQAGVEKALAGYLQHVPQYARYFDVSLDENGVPRPDELSRAAQERVMVEVAIE